MADALSARQQIVDKIKEASNILVTVGNSPSVDELSAALGLTIMLNKLGKHGTAVVSGEIPPAITFLDPEKTFENTVDSLRDFIIALDKEKADHLRYKVEGDVVKIFITPYRTTITKDDLDFSQGDYNVELVLGLGVKDEAHLDTALEAHGKILHDATVATISNGSEPSTLGSIDWYDAAASSLCEMLVGLSEAIKQDKPILDEQISTALLTGIVASTDRFSNERTSAKVMTMAAQLMAAGANQQLIATKLEEAHEIAPKSEVASDGASKEASDGSTEMSEGASTKLPRKNDEKVTDKKPKDGTLSISHEMKGDVDEVAEQVAEEKAQDAAKEAKNQLDEQLEEAAKDTKKRQNEEAAREAERKLAEELQSVAPTASAPKPQDEPLLGGTLNATAEEAAEEKRREEEDDRNKTILSHGETGHVLSNAPVAVASPLNASMTPVQQPSGATDGLFGQPADLPGVVSADHPTIQPAPFISEPPQPVVVPQQQSAPNPTLADIDAEHRGEVSHEDARAAVAAAFDTPASPVMDAPSLPAFNDLLMPPPPPLPPMPPLPGQDVVQGPELPLVNEPQLPQAPNDPGQFKIPGQG